MARRSIPVSIAIVARRVRRGEGLVVTLRIPLLLAVLTLSMIFTLNLAVKGDPEPRVVVVQVTETISSITSENIDEALSAAQSTNSPLVLSLDTLGGELEATFHIIDSIERSNVPTICYVSPSGAKAASAGTIILLSCHVAAMAPNTIIGSAQPVVITPTGAEPVTDSKTINFLTNYVKNRPQVIANGRNQTAAQEFITKNLNLNAQDAFTFGVTDYAPVASLGELLAIVDGKMASTANGPYVFRTANAEIAEWTPSVRVLVLRTLANPVLASVLFFIGLYWLIFGITTPGHGSEIGGAILLITGLLGLGVLGANLGALVLIGIGAALLLAELFTHAASHGVLALGGFIAIALGSLLLFSFRPFGIGQETLLTLFLVLLSAPIGFGGFFIFATYKVIQVRRRKPMEWSLIGDLAEAVDELELGVEGFVIYQGEFWKAISDGAVKKGEKVKITAKEGPMLKVSPMIGPSQTDIPSG